MKKRKIILSGVEFTLGQSYRETVTGNTGIATQGVSYLTGCDQLLLVWNDSTGRPVEHWAHTTNIEDVAVEEAPGGPAPSFANNDTK